MSGIVPVDPETNEFVRTSIADEAHRAFKNVAIVMEELGINLSDALKVTLYLTDMNDFAEVNNIYKEYFGPDYPARTAIQVGKLPMNVGIEVDVIAAYKK